MNRCSFKLTKQYKLNKEVIFMTSDNVVSVPGEVVTTRDSPQLSVGWMSQVTMQGQCAGLLHTDTHTAPALSTVSCYHAAGVGGNRREYRGGETSR